MIPTFSLTLSLLLLKMLLTLSLPKFSSSKNSSRPRQAMVVDSGRELQGEEEEGGEKSLERKSSVQWYMDIEKAEIRRILTSSHSINIKEY